MERLMSYIKMRDEWKLLIGWIVIVTLLLLSGCASTSPPAPNEKSTPQCCIGQDKHTCGMPGMPDKPEQERK
jgi:hypothetical protein